MSLFRRLTSFGSPSSSDSALSVDENDRQYETNMTPEDDRMKALKVHCKNIQDTLLTSETSKNSLENCRRVLDHFCVITNIICEEKSQDGQLGSCLELVLENGIFEEIFAWSLGQRACMKELIKEQLKIYKSLLKRSKQPVLIFEEIVVPLKRLLRSCSGKLSNDIEIAFVDVLHQLCVCVNQDVSLLNTHFINASSPTEASFSVFSLLIPYLHNEGEVGSRSRDAVLLCTSLSMFQEPLANFICEETTFCPVLATGLSGLYSRLPNTLDVPEEDWYSLEKGIWTTLPELKSFVTSLEFCNDVIQTAHPRIQSKLLDLIYNGFLVSVMAPALNQNSSDALIAATAYFDLFLGSITEPKLMKVFLKFLLQEKFDEVRILHSLFQRLDAKNELCLVTLALFQTLVNLNSEDVMIELVLKYLLPCNHVMGSQRKMIQEMDLYGKVAVRFLTLTPSCCFPETSCETSLDETCRVDNEKDEEKPASSVTAAEPLTLSSDFLTYLLDVRKSLSDRRQACLCWSALWDGLDPTYEEPGVEAKTDTETSLSNGGVVHNSSSSPNIAQFCTEDQKPERTRSLSGETDKLELLLGPFITKLFHKLEKMPNNSVFVNQVITGIISSLAEYPQALLRSFLLNHSLVLQPDVKSIFQILSSVKAKVDACLSQLDNLEQPLLLARQRLVVREESRKRSDSRHPSLPPSPRLLKEHKQQPRRASDTPSSRETSSPCRNTFVEARPSIEPEDLSSDKDLELAIENVSSWILLNLGPKGISRERTRRKHINIMKNAVYCAVLMEEWMKELAAISLEHVIQPYSDSEKASE